MPKEYTLEELMTPIPVGVMPQGDTVSSAKTTGMPWSLDDLLATPEKEERGVVSELGHALVTGGYESAEMYARAARTLGYDTTAAIEKIKEWKGKWEPTREGYIWDSINQGVASTVQSVTGGAPGIAAGLAGGPTTGVLGFGLSAATLFSLSEYDSFLEEAEEQGIARELVHDEAVMSAIYEGGIEGLQDILGAKVLGFFGKGLITNPIKRTLLQSIGNIGKKTAQVGAIEIPGEMVTAAGQVSEREKAGMKTPGYLESMASAGGAAGVMSLIMGPLGGGIASRMPYNRQDVVTDEDIEELEAQRQTVLLNIQEQYAADALTTDDLISLKSEPDIQGLGIDDEINELIIESKAAEPAIPKTEEPPIDLTEVIGRDFDERPGEGVLIEGQPITPEEQMIIQPPEPDFLEVAKERVGGVPGIEEIEREYGEKITDEEREVMREKFPTAATDKAKSTRAADREAEADKQIEHGEGVAVGIKPKDIAKKPVVKGKIYRQGRPDGKWWTPDKEYAESFGKKGKKVHEKELPANLKLIDEVELRKSMTEAELAKDAFDGVLGRLGYNGMIRLEESMSGEQHVSYYIPAKPKKVEPRGAEEAVEPVKAKPEGKVEPTEGLPGKGMEAKADIKAMEKKLKTAENVTKFRPWVRALGGIRKKGSYHGEIGDIQKGARWQPGVVSDKSSSIPMDELLSTVKNHPVWSQIIKTENDILDALTNNTKKPVDKYGYGKRDLDIVNDLFTDAAKEDTFQLTPEVGTPWERQAELKKEGVVETPERSGKKAVFGKKGVTGKGLVGKQKGMFGEEKGETRDLFDDTELATKQPTIKFDVTSMEQYEYYGKVAASIIPMLKRAGASKEVIDRITVELKPLLIVNLDKASESLKNWQKQGKTIDDVIEGLVGVTTVNNLHALIELSLANQTPKLFEHTFYHEYFHVASKWVLPSDAYSALEKHFGNEEAMAEAFADYMMKPKTREKLPGLIRRIFLKLRQMFRSVGNGLRKQGVTKAEDIFGKLSEGKYEPHFKKAAVMPELSVKKPFNAKEFLEAIPEYKQFQEAMSDPSTKRVIDEAFDNMSYFKKRFGKQIIDKDMKLMKRIFTLPYWAGKEYKHIGKAVQIEIDLAEERSKIVFKDYNDTKLGEIQTSLPKNKKAFKQYNELTWKMDGKRFSKKDVPADWHKEIVRGQDIEINPEHYAQVEALLTKQGYEADAVEAFVEVRKILDQKYVDIDKLMRIENANPTLIEEFRKEFGKIHNYFPHRRTGNAYVQVVSKQGKILYREHYNDKKERAFTPIKKKAYARTKQWAEDNGKTGYRIKQGVVTSLPDEAYYQIKVQDMQQIAAEAGRLLEQYRAEYESERLMHKEGYTKEEALKRAKKKMKADMEEALSKTMAEVFKVRGWARHGVRRKNIPGHETKDTFGILYDYLNGYAGFKTKIKRAKAHSANMMEVNAKDHPKEYNYLSNYVKDVLSNSDRVDRVVDGIRALFFVKYLGFVPKSGMVNLTQNIILAAPLLSQYTKGSHIKLGKAMVDVRKSLISKEALTSKEVKYGHLPKIEQTALHDMIEGGTTMDLYLREVKGKIPGTGWGKYANKFVEKSGIFMMLAEKFNRASTGLAAFRVAYNEGITLKDGTSTKNDYDKAIRWAKKRVYDAHFLYGKANYPELMRGSVTGKIMRSAYTFRTFTHNYLLCMANLLTKQGPEGKKAFARSMRNILIMGGLTSIPFFKAMSEMLTWVMGDDDKDPLTVARGIMPYDWMKDIVTYGLPGAMGFDLTGSLSIEVPRNWYDILGVPYAGWEDSVNMVKSLKSGQIYRAISETPITPIMVRNSMRGLELYTKGQISRSGKAINYIDQMGPKKITTKQFVGKSLLGLQPTAVSKGYGAYKATSKMEKAIQRRQSNWASQYVNALRANDKVKRDKILKDIEDWNKKAQKERKFYKIINIKDAVRSRLQPGYKTIPKKMRQEALKISEQWR